jgi:hypothetical protein
MRLRKLALGLFWFLNGRHVNANPVPSNETLLDSLVLVSAYIFPNQSALEGAVKDPSWQRYNNVDASSYWSTGKQDMQTTDVSVMTYAYPADNLARRDGAKRESRTTRQPRTMKEPSTKKEPRTTEKSPLTMPQTIDQLTISQRAISRRIINLRRTANLQIPRIDKSRISRSPITSQNSPKFQRTDGILARNLRLGTTRLAKDRLRLINLLLERGRTLSRNPRLGTTCRAKGRLRQINLLLETRRTLSRNPSRNLISLTFFGIKRLLPNIILQSMWVQRMSNRHMNSRSQQRRTTEHMTRHTQSHPRELTHRNPDLTLDQAARVALNRTLLTLMVSQSILMPMASRSIMMSKLEIRYVL